MPNCEVTQLSIVFEGANKFLEDGWAQHGPAEINLPEILGSLNVSDHLVKRYL